MGVAAAVLGEQVVAHAGQAVAQGHAQQQLVVARGLGPTAGLGLAVEVELVGSNGGGGVHGRREKMNGKRWQKRGPYASLTKQRRRRTAPEPRW